jgi:3D (Asp-Asp-Asp) domain-containing protein/peptidoglycan hydrolase CwlO-like protein
VLDLYSLDTRVTDAKQRLAALESATSRLRGQRAALSRELVVAHVDTRLSQDRLASRLRSLYEHGTTTSLDIVMGASTLEDAMTQLDDFNRFTAANTAVLLQVRTAEHHLTLLRDELSQRERSLAATTRAAAQTVAELRQVRTQKVAYIADLATRRSLDAARIAQLTAEATAADARSQTLTSRQTAQATPPVLGTQPEPDGALPAAVAPAGVATAGGRSMTVVATGYDLPGRTATGLPVGWGIAAVDPSVIPLGTHIVVPGYGVAVAADTGVYGSSIDLWFPTTAQAYAWGRRTVTIAVD